MRRKRLVLAGATVGVAVLGAWWVLGSAVRTPEQVAHRLRPLLDRVAYRGPIQYWWGDLVRTAEVVDGVAFVGLGTRLGVLDLSDAVHPTLIRTFDLLGIVHGFARVGSTLLCAHGESGVSAFDVADARHPRWLDRIHPSGYGMHVAAIDDRYVLYSAETGGWYVLDASDPRHLLPVAHEDGAWVSSARVAGSTAYVLDGGQGVVAYDLADPLAPVRLGTAPIQLPLERYEPDPPPIWMEIAGSYGYVANGSDGIRVLDLSDPRQPRTVAHLPLEGYSYTTAIRGDRLYLANIAIGLVVIDVSRPTEPKIQSVTSTRGTAYDMAFRGDLIYLSDGASGLAIFDVADPDHPAEVGYWQTPPVTRRVALAEGLLVTADGSAGVGLYSLATPAHPRPIARFDTPGLAADVAILGSRAYVADVLAGFTELDLADPANPRFVRRFALEEHPWAVHADGSHLCGAMGHHGFAVYDVGGDEPRATYHAFHKSEGVFGYAISAVCAGPLALAGDIITGMSVYDVSDVQQPRQIGLFRDKPGTLVSLTKGFLVPVPGMVLEGNRAYLARYNRGIATLDVSQPSAPREVGRLALDGYVYGLSLDGDRLCASTYDGSLYVARRNPPDETFRVEHRWRLPGELYDVTCRGPTAYVAAGTGGLAIVDVATGKHELSAPR